jgi:uncharacterized protein with PIN domain
MALAPARASFRFYAELNDHLPPELQYRAVEREFFVPASVKDTIESFGIPHTEVDLVLINGESSDFSRLVQNGDRVAVYPVFESLDITPELRLRPQTLRDPRFVLDVHLGRLAAYLRMLGFDAVYDNYASDTELARISSEEKRILLTRDRGLLKHAAVTHGYWVRETDSRRQAAEIVRRFDLARLARPFTRCMACNELPQAASKSEVRSRVPRALQQIAMSSNTAFVVSECTGEARITGGCGGGSKNWRLAHRCAKPAHPPMARSSVRRKSSAASIQTRNSAGI